MIAEDGVGERSIVCSLFGVAAASCSYVLQMFAKKRGCGVVKLSMKERDRIAIGSRCGRGRHNTAIAFGTSPNASGEVLSDCNQMT